MNVLSYIFHDGCILTQGTGKDVCYVFSFCLCIRSWTLFYHFRIHALFILHVLSSTPSVPAHRICTVVLVITYHGSPYTYSVPFYIYNALYVTNCIMYAPCRFIFLSFYFLVENGSFIGYTWSGVTNAYARVPPFQQIRWTERCCSSFIFVLLPTITVLHWELSGILIYNF